MRGPGGGPQPGRHAPAGARGWLRRAGDGDLRRQLVAIGLVSIVLHVAIVATALDGLQEVQDAHADVARITTAQRFFQDADMAHDAMWADTTVLLLLAARGTAAEAMRGPAADLERDVAEFREHLARVDSVTLPDELAASLQDIRPLQEQYAAEVERMGRLLTTDPASAAELERAVTTQYDVLTAEQADITDAMSALAARRQAAARADERSVQWRLLASAVAALLGLLGLTLLLRRLGGALVALLARERDVAETLQRSLLPDRLPDLPGMRLAARYVAGGAGTQVGGDWYDVIGLPSGEVGLVMGDVVGHDLRAASSMGQLRNALRAYAADGAPPHEVLQRLNHLCIDQDLGDMATVLYAVLDPVRGTVRLASAGHYPPLLVTEHDRRYLEDAPCPPIGAARDAQYTSAVHTVPPGSLLVLYTDGLVERRDRRVEHGLARLQELVASPSSGEVLQELCDEVLSGMLGDDAPGDDVALLVVAPQATLGPHLDVLWPAQAERLSSMRRLLERWLDEAGATDEERYEILVACSEAATNAIEHAYGLGPAEFRIACDVRDGTVTVLVRDWGQWRAARGQDRGRGLFLIDGLMDDVRVSHGEHGTEVWMSRALSRSEPVAQPAEQQGVPV